MEPENIRFGGGAADTMLHPLVAVWMVIAILLIIFLARKYAIIPLLAAAFTVPVGQVVVLGGFHFTVLRILIIAGLIRWALSSRPPGDEMFVGGFNAVDRLTTLWIVASLVIFSLQWMETQALIRSLGDFLDALGGFFVVRFLIQDKDDIQRSIKVLAWTSLVVGLCMIIEQVRMLNLFGLLGGVPIVPAVREGQIRSQGPFGVYIDAGVFGSILIPLLVWMWSDAKSRLTAAIGFIGTTAMTICSHSSTSLLAFAAGIAALCFWPFRKRMRTFRWGVLCTLVALHLVMKAPVWALISRVDLTGSSSSYHRFILVDNCIRHFSDWWLLGTKIYDTWGWDMWDLSNEFVARAFTGGLLTLFFFIWALSRAFGQLGTARKAVEGNRKEEWFVWSLGATLFATFVSFFGCSFMAQMQVEFFIFLACISVACFEATQAGPVPSPLPANPRLSRIPKLARLRTSSAKQ